MDHYRVLTKRAQREQVKEELPPVAIYDKQERNELLLLLSGLPELDRDIFLMKYYLQLPNNEIAQRLDLTKAAVDNRLYRGKQTLAGQLKERWT
ncbi:sigma-70 family RNA polymerase sigma factor [Metalysinibacillus jejuensis]|uniref:sigma-70 family RNA polymerase sigma factor n=1 Tax=Metalysinibacillus jejuensis TaxID=914327 RepID=UPI001F361095|nr:sigma-70 family RNA polymerase sigma factor [Metalysinibacillus jejuensis]